MPSVSPSLPSPSPTLEPVWRAMSEHFLDTETRHLLAQTALVCLRAGLTQDMAREVWEADLVPLLTPNLLDIAGEWAGWEDAWLFGKIRRRREAGDSWLRRWRRRQAARLSAKELGVVLACMEGLRARPDETWEATVTVLTRLFREAVDLPLYDAIAPPRPDAALRLEAYGLIRPVLLEEERQGARERMGLL